MKMAQTINVPKSNVPFILTLGQRKCERIPLESLASNWLVSRQKFILGTVSKGRGVMGCSPRDEQSEPGLLFAFVVAQKAFRNRKTCFNPGNSKRSCR